MNLYYLNNLVNSIVAGKQTVRSGMRLNELLNEAHENGCKIEIDKDNKKYLITKGADNSDVTGII